MKKIDRYDIIPKKKINNTKIKILIVDDQNFVRNFLQHILATESNFQIVGTANNGQDAIKKVASLQPDLVLIDLEMPEMDGTTATAIIARKYSQCKILVLTSYKDSEHLQKALRAGANGYLLKDSSPQEITRAIYSVAQGHTQLSPGLLEKVLAPEIHVVPEAKRENITKLSLSVEPKTTAKISQKSSLNSFYSLFPLFLLMATLVIPLVFFTKVDRTIKIKGQLITKGELIKLDSPVDGKVIALDVKEGEKVTQGETLIQLESPSINEQIQQQQQTLINQQNQLSGLDFLKNQQLLALRNQEQDNKAQVLEKQISIEQLQQNLEALKTSYNNYLTEKTAQLESAYEAIAQAKSAHQLAEIYQSVARSKIQHYQTTKNQGDLGTAEPFHDRDNLVEAEKSLAESQAKLNQTKLEISQATNNFQAKQDSYNKLQQKISDDIEQTTLRIKEQQKSYQFLLNSNNTGFLDNQKSLQQTEQKIALLQQEIAKTNASIKDLKSQSTQRSIYTPIDGVVDRLSVQKIGTIVQQKQPLVYIFPEKQPLIFKGKISQRNGDLLEVGVPVQLKIYADGFPKTSNIPGRLSWISSHSTNAKNSEIANTNIKANTLDIEVKLERNYIQSQDRQLFLTPGETATAEIIIKQGRLLDWLLKNFSS